MSTLHAFSAVLLVCLSACASQEAPDSAAVERAEINREALIARLDLTDEQVEEVVPIIEAASQQRLAILRSVREEADGRPDRGALSALRTEMDQIDRAERERLAQFLTPDQLSAYDEYREEVRAKRQERRREQMRKRFRDR